MAFGDKTGKGTSLTVYDKIAEQITSLAPQVEADVVDALVQRELNKRSEAVVIVMDQLSKLELDLRKIKPDQTFDGEGKVVSETYTKAKFEELKKLREKITKFSSAITKALEKADFTDVYNIKNQKSGGSPSSEETDTATN